jgi:dTDP-4-dehydrorhamnose 3,5-epimerase
VIFTETAIPGCFLIQIEPIWDERGFFARTWCEMEFREHGLNSSLRQASLSFNFKKGTLRGMHYQVGGSQEAKLIRCISGSIFDVVIDLRKDSPAFARHIGVLLSAENPQMVYIPEGCAHGYQTLADKTELFYQISQFYNADLSRGVRWNDPVFAIAWPLPDPIVSSRDQSFPDFDARSGCL